jgi:hypothetical protein
MNIDLNLMKLDYCPEYFEIKIPNFRGGEIKFTRVISHLLCV